MRQNGTKRDEITFTILRRRHENINNALGEWVDGELGDGAEIIATQIALGSLVELEEAFVDFLHLTLGELGDFVTRW